MVEYVHQFLLEMRIFLDFLEIVEEQEIIFEQVVPRPEGVALEPDGVQRVQLIDRSGENPGIVVLLAEFVGHGFEQMGLAGPARAADDERVEQRSRLFCDFFCRSDREIVFLVYQERIEREFLPERKVDPP